MTPSREVPFLASDNRRGYVILAVSVPTSIAAGLIIGTLDPGLDTRTLTTATLFVSWAFIALLTGVLTIAVFGRAEPDELRRWLMATAPRDFRARIWGVVNGGGATGWAITGSVIAVIAVLVLAFNPQFTSSALVVYSGIAVVVGSLFMTIVAYAVRYARHFATLKGIEFPGGDAPRFMDFVYLSVQVSTTFSASDVAITTTRARRLVTGNSLISFAFNTVIVALLVSVLVSAIG